MNKQEFHQCAGIRVSDIFSPKQSLCHLTEKAIEIAKQLSWLFAEAKKGEGSLSNSSLGKIVDDLVGKIRSLFKQGAHRQTVMEFLKI